MTARQLTRVLPDDGVIDSLAVQIAATGSRLVALTPTERQLAAASILARGGTPHIIATRLPVSGATACRLAACCLDQPREAP